MANRTDAATQRAQARRQRRSKEDSDAEPAPQLDDAKAGDRSDARDAAKAAAAAAVVGAAVGTIRALASRRDEDGERTDDIDELADNVAEDGTPASPAMRHDLQDSGTTD